MDPVGTGMVFGGQTIHLSHIATFLNHLGIFGWLIFFCNHLLLYQNPTENHKSSNNNLTNNSSITYILPLPNIFVALETWVFWLVPPYFHTPFPHQKPRLFPAKPASSKPHLYDLQDARTEVEHRLAGTLRGELVLLTERTPKKPEYLIALGTDLQVPFNSQWTTGVCWWFLGCGRLCWSSEKHWLGEFVAILGVYSQFWGFSNYIHLDLLCFFNGVDRRGFVTMKKHRLGFVPNHPRSKSKTKNMHGRHGSSFWSWWMCSFDVFLPDG